MPEAGPWRRAAGSRSSSWGIRMKGQGLLTAIAKTRSPITNGDKNICRASRSGKSLTHLASKTCFYFLLLTASLADKNVFYL